MDLLHLSTIFVQTKNARILHHRKSRRQFFPFANRQNQGEPCSRDVFPKPGCRKITNPPKQFPKSTGLDKAMQMDEKNAQLRLPEQVFPHFHCLPCQTCQFSHFLRTLQNRWRKYSRILRKMRDVLAMLWLHEQVKFSFFISLSEIDHFCPRPTFQHLGIAYSE